jgi:cytosine/adenosine deaminase-related metal-dependent hydrolase
MILRSVHVVGDDGPARDVGVSGAVIASVGEAGGLYPQGAPLVDLGSAIAFPGLVNSHDHLEFNLYPLLAHDRYADYVAWSRDIQRADAATIAAIERVPKRTRLRWGALKNLLCGVTAVAHHGDATDDTSGLAVETVPNAAIHSTGLGRRWRSALNGPANGSPYAVHVGEGTSRRAWREAARLLRWNLRRRALVGVHAMAMTAAQASRFRALVWCPLSNASLYGASANVAAFKGRTSILFGTDSTLTGSWNLWSHLRLARSLGDLEDRELFAALTAGARTAWGLRGSGRLAAGETADVVVARKKTRGTWDAFFAVEPKDILLVLRAGKVLLCDASLPLTPEGVASSVVRVDGSDKRVAEDVPGLLAAIRSWGVAPNLPVS